MARRYKKGRRHGRRKMTVPIAIAAPVLAMGYDIATKAMSGNVAGLKGTYTGVWENGKFNAGQVIETYGPLAAGAIIHIAASKLGVNRAIASAGVPLMRV